jgi:hypothetical protein
MALVVGSPPGTTGRRPGAAAWTLDLEAFAAEFSTLWEALGPVRDIVLPATGTVTGVHPGTERVRSGDTGPMRRAAMRAWTSSDPAVIDHVSRLAVSTPEEWMAEPDDTHLGHWFRLILASHLTPLDTPPLLGELRGGLEELGWSPMVARRMVWGRDLAELAEEVGPDTFGPAVALALGHGQRGWLTPDDLTEARDLLASTSRERFRTVQHLLEVIEAWWNLLGAAAETGRPLVLCSSPSAGG